MKKVTFILSPISITLIYLVLVSLWIIYSDHFLDVLALSEEVKAWFKPIKNVFFILVTGIILYVLIYAGQTRLKRYSKTLIDEKVKYQLLVDESPFAIIAHQNGKIIFANPSAVTMLDAREEKDLLDVKISSLLHPLDKEASKLRMKIMEGNEDPKYPVELRLISLKNQEIQLEVTAHTFNFKDEIAVQVFLMDVGERTRNEKKIALALEEKTVLLSEIHHRVKNNMAIISALIQLHSFEIDDKKLVGILNDSVSRIKSISMIHENLYQSKNMNSILFDEYIIEMTKQISNDFEHHPGISFSYQLEPIKLNLNHAVSCALFLNEVIHNFYKYTFESSIQHNCIINYYKEHEQVFISFIDKNQGLSNWLNPSKKTLTLQLIEIIASQLSGKLDIDAGKETTITLSFAQDIEQRGSVSNMQL